MRWPRPGSTTLFALPMSLTAWDRRKAILKKARRREARPRCTLLSRRRACGRDGETACRSARSGWGQVPPSVILSAAKDLRPAPREILRCAQDDSRASVNASGDKPRPGSCVLVANRKRLTFRVLRGLASAFEAGLLAFLHTRVAC